MFREMFLVTGLSKLLEKDASSMDAVEVLKMATVNGAKAMRLNRADVLAKGKYADLIMIDLHPAQYASHSQHPQESGLQRQQVQCLHDHDRRQDFVS